LHFLPYPTVFHWAAALYRQMILMQDIVEVSVVVADYKQYWDFVVYGGPHGGHAHEEIAVTADGKR
jgi:hypothetical protein